MKLDKQYEEQVYAGVLGKIIGVYLGRPFEGWTYERIMEELGPINYYVNDNPTISDSNYDILIRELENLEKQNPHLIQDFSPTKRVGHHLHQNLIPQNTVFQCYLSPMR